MLRFSESTLSRGCKDEHMVQLSVDGSDFENMVGRVDLKDTFEQIHGKLCGHSHVEGGNMRKQTSSIFTFWNIASLR